MIAVQQAAPVPDPLSVPANAPEHCPVSLLLSGSLWRIFIRYLSRERNQNLRARQTLVRGVQTRRYVPPERRENQIPPYLSCGNVCRP